MNNAVTTTVDVLGVPVAGWTAPLLTEAMIEAAQGRPPPGWSPRATIHYANVHVLNTAYEDATLREQLNTASTVYCDGTGVVLGSAILGSSLPPRITAADWINGFCSRAATAGVRLFLLGGRQGVATRASHALVEQNPDLQIAGAHHGFVDAEASRRVVEVMNAARADIVLIGMGTPIQERWISRYRNGIDAPVVWSVGALFDFVAGVEQRAPGWLADRGMEWLFRWTVNPKRLTRRYLVGNPLFFFRILRQRRTAHRRR